MATKLYLHIGHPKCGSSTLQQALYENRLALLKIGIGVLDDKLQLMKSSSRLRFPLAFFATLLTGYSKSEDPGECDAKTFAFLDERFRGLAAKAEAQGLHAVVLSAENLARPAALAMLAAAKPYFDCEILYYIRRHDEWLVSSWLQWQFKSGISLEAFINESLKARAILYRNTIEACFKYFSAEQLRLKALFPGHLVGGDLVTDFWTAIGVQPETMEPVQARNVSFSPQLISVLKESPYLFVSNHDNALTSFIECHHHAKPGVKKYFPLPKARRQEILDHFRPEIRWLKQGVFKDDDGLKGWLGIRDDQVKPKDDAVTLEGLAEMLNLQLAALKELREDVDKIKSRLAIR